MKLDVEGLGRITHHVIVVEELAWPLLVGYDAMAIYGAKIDAGRGTVSWDWEGARRRAEVVLAKQEHLPAYSMRIGQKRRVSTAFSLGSGHLNVVSGLYYVNRQGETFVCLVNETAKEAVIRDKELLGEHIPTAADDMVTQGELLTVKNESPSKPRDSSVGQETEGHRRRHRGPSASDRGAEGATAASTGLSTRGRVTGQE